MISQSQLIIVDILDLIYLCLVYFLEWLQSQHSAIFTGVILFLNYFIGIEHVLFDGISDLLVFGGMPLFD